MSLEMIKFLEEMAETLDQWARDSTVGGWSTHQVAANRHEADKCYLKARELRKCQKN